MASTVFTASHMTTIFGQSDKLASVERNSLYLTLHELQRFLNKFDEVTDTVDEVNPVDVYMDFQKAFDEVPSSTDKKLAMSQTTDYYEALFHRLHTQYQEMPVMGLLLMYSNHYIHLLESSIDMLYSIIRDLANPLPEERLAQSDIKILVLSHNIPDRLYRQWLQRPINMPVTLMMDTSETEPVEKLVPECLALLLKLGNFILQNPKLVDGTYPILGMTRRHYLAEIATDLKTITKPNLSVSDEVRHLIIKENTIKSLCGSSELMTPQKFLEYYEKSMHVVLDSGGRDGNGVRSHKVTLHPPFRNS